MTEVLRDIIYSTSSLSIETQSDSARCIRLALLHPLANTEMLAACRNPNSRFLRNCKGSIVRPSNHETLDIRPLGLAWRQVMANVSPFYEVTFDVTLQTKESITTPSNTQELYWEDTVPSEGGVAIITQEVMNLVICLATAIRMRTKGDLCFKVTSDDHELTHPILRWNLLQKQLLALAKHKASE
jgi:hypothetical protein